MADESVITIPTRGLELSSLLELPDDVIRGRLITSLRKSGVVFRSRRDFEKTGWGEEPTPRFAKFWSVRAGETVVSRDRMLWDLREPLLRDEALTCCCALLYRRALPYAVRWIGGIETAAIPIVAGLLTINAACGGPPLNGFYLRKARKRDGLRRLLEGPRPPRGERVLLVDDILNKGVSKRALVDYCATNDLVPAALLVVVDAERQGGAELFAPVCPVESLFTRSDVLTREDTHGAKVIRQVSTSEGETHGRDCTSE